MLLPPRFRDPIAAMPLGPVVKRADPAPQAHAHDWKPSAASKDHVVCHCGAVTLRGVAVVEPVQIGLFGDEQDPDWEVV